MQPYQPFEFATFVDVCAAYVEAAAYDNRVFSPIDDLYSENFKEKVFAPGK